MLCSIHCVLFTDFPGFQWNWCGYLHRWVSRLVEIFSFFPFCAAKILLLVVSCSWILFSSASVVEQLEHGDFFSKTITKQHLFASVHDAVLFCLNHRGATSVPRYDPTRVSLWSWCSGPELAQKVSDSQDKQNALIFVHKLSGSYWK